MSVVFLDVATALRRYEAISVGDAAPFPSGVSVGVRRGDRITFTVGLPNVLGEWWRKRWERARERG